MRVNVQHTAGSREPKCVTPGGSKNVTVNDKLVGRRLELSTSTRTVLGIRRNYMYRVHINTSACEALSFRETIPDA